MLMTAFHGTPCGSIPNTIEGIATASHLTVQEVTANLPVLKGGWKLSKTEMTFVPMSDLAERLSEHYTEPLIRLQDAATIAITAPDLFNSELLPTQGLVLKGQVGESTRAKADELGTSRVKRQLPIGAGISPRLQDYLISKGFPLETHDELWERFTDYHRSKQLTSGDWSATFRHWMVNQIGYGHVTPANNKPSVLSQQKTKFTFGAKSGPPSRGEQAAVTSAAALDNASRLANALRQGPAPTQHGELVA